MLKHWSRPLISALILGWLLFFLDTERGLWLDWLGMFMAGAMLGMLPDHVLEAWGKQRGFKRVWTRED